MNNEIQDQAAKIAANAEKILTLTTNEARIFSSIKDLGKKIYLSKGVSADDIEIITSRALALLSLMRKKA